MPNGMLAWWIQDAHFIGRGLLFGPPAFFWEKRHQSTRRSRLTAPANLEPRQRIEPPKELGLGLGVGFGVGLRLESGWSGPTCKVEIDHTPPHLLHKGFLQDAPAQGEPPPKKSRFIWNLNREVDKKKKWISIETSISFWPEKSNLGEALFQSWDATLIRPFCMQYFFRFKNGPFSQKAKKHNLTRLKTEQFHRFFWNPVWHGDLEYSELRNDQG